MENANKAAEVGQQDEQPVDERDNVGYEDLEAEVVWAVDPMRLLRDVDLEGPWLGLMEQYEQNPNWNYAEAMFVLQMQNNFNFEVEEFDEWDSNVTREISRQCG